MKGEACQMVFPVFNTDGDHIADRTCADQAVGTTEDATRVCSDCASGMLSEGFLVTPDGGYRQVCSEEDHSSGCSRRCHIEKSPPAQGSTRGFRPRILLDVDGVLADFVSPVLRVVKAITDREYAYNDVTTWEMSEALKWSKDVDEAVRATIARPGFCRALPVYDGAQEGVERLRELGDVYIATSPFDSDYWAREREAWLAEHFGFKRKHIMSGSAKFLLDAHVLIDDKYENVKGWVDERMRTGITFAQPWNKHHKPRVGLREYRTDCWKTIAHIVGAIT